VELAWPELGSLFPQSTTIKFLSVSKATALRQQLSKTSSANSRQSRSWLSSPLSSCYTQVTTGDNDIRHANHGCREIGCKERLQTRCSRTKPSRLRPRSWELSVKAEPCLFEAKDKFMVFVAKVKAKPYKTVRFGGQGQCLFESKDRVMNAPSRC